MLNIKINKNKLEQEPAWNRVKMDSSLQSSKHLQYGMFRSGPHNQILRVFGKAKRVGADLNLRGMIFQRLVTWQKRIFSWMLSARILQLMWSAACPFCEQVGHSYWTERVPQVARSHAIKALKVVINILNWAWKHTGNKVSSQKTLCNFYKIAISQLIEAKEC